MIAAVTILSLASEGYNWTVRLSRVVPHINQDRLRWAILGFGLSGIVLVHVISAIRRRLRIEFSFHGSYGSDARLIVMNRGESAEFVASAEILDIQEPASNIKRLQHFNPCWIESGRSRAHISEGSRQVLRLATAITLDAQHKLNEMQILEDTPSGPKILDSFRWYSHMDAPPSITLQVSISRMTRPSRPHEETIVIEGGRTGGIRIARPAS